MDGQLNTAMVKTPIDDLWLRTLSQIPALYGRLVYLAGLRNPDTGRYEHHGLALVFGSDDADAALRQSHERTFSDWTVSSLEQQKADLDLYLSDLPTPNKILVENWLNLTPYRGLVPASASAPGRELYLADLEALLELLKNEYGAAHAAQDE